MQTFLQILLVNPGTDKFFLCDYYIDLNTTATFLKTYTTYLQNR